MLFKPLTAILLAFLAQSLQLTTAAKQATATKATPKCNDPDRKTLENLWAFHGGWHESLYNVGNLVDNLQNMNLSNVPKEFVNTRFHSLGASSCPYRNKDQDLIAAYLNSPQYSSLCPTYDVLNYDPNRIPETLFEKRCSCKHCALMDTKVPGNTLHYDRFQCEKVTYYTRVLRRVGCAEDDVYIYNTILEPITIACTCDDRRKRLHSSKQ